MANLTVSHKNRRYFQDPAGYPVFLSGYTAPDLLSRNDLAYRAVLTQLAERGVNGLRIPIEATDRDPSFYVTPHKRIKGNRRTPQGHRRFDLSALNPAYFERLHALARQASENGIFVQLVLFLETGSREDWAASAWNPANNINGDEEAAPDDEAAYRAFFDLSPSDGAETQGGGAPSPYQEALVDAALEAVQGLPNISLHLSGGPEAPSAWVQSLASLLSDGSYAPLLVDFAYAGQVQAETLAGYVTATHTSSPVEEPRILLAQANSADDFRSVRIAAWNTFLSGAQPFRPLTLNAASDLALHGEEAKALTCVRRFIKSRKVRFWTMRLCPGITEGRPCLTRDAERFLTFLPEGGPLKIDLSAAEGAYTVGWWNIEGEFLETKGSVLGGGVRELVPPDGGLWALDLFKIAPR